MMPLPLPTLSLRALFAALAAVCLLILAGPALAIGPYSGGSGAKPPTQTTRPQARDCISRDAAAARTPSRDGDHVVLCPEPGRRGLLHHFFHGHRR